MAQFGASCPVCHRINNLGTQPDNKGACYNCGAQDEWKGTRAGSPKKWVSGDGRRSHRLPRKCWGCGWLHAKFFYETEPSESSFWFYCPGNRRSLLPSKVVAAPLLRGDQNLPAMFAVRSTHYAHVGERELATRWRGSSCSLVLWFQRTKVDRERAEVVVPPIIGTEPPPPGLHEVVTHYPEPPVGG
jgi:hypothetical protein